MSETETAPAEETPAEEPQDPGDTETEEPADAPDGDDDGSTPKNDPVPDGEGGPEADAVLERTT